MSQETDKQALLGELPGRGARRRWLALALVVALAAAGVAGWRLLGNRVAPRFVTQTVARGDIQVMVTATGTLNPTRTVSIGSELSGIVRKVNVDVNSVVKAGETLIELDTAKLVSAVNQARATLASAKAQLGEANATLVEAQAKMRRYEELNRTSGGKLPSRSDLDVQEATVLKAEAGVNSAKAAIDDAQATLDTELTNLSKASIVSPVDGVVLSRTVEPGYAVAATLQAVELLSLATDLRFLELQADIDEADVGQVSAGQRSTFTVAAFPDKHFDATLSKVAWGANTTDDNNVVTYTGYFEVPNEDLLLRPGMTATATIQTAERKGALLVPSTAFRFRPQAESSSSLASSLMPRPPSNQSKQARETVSQASRERTLYLLRDGRPVELTVRAGLTDGRRTEILEGDLKEGDQVITEQLSAGER